MSSLPLRSPIIENTEENIRRIFDVNVLGVWHSMRAQIPHPPARAPSRRSPSEATRRQYPR